MRAKGKDETPKFLNTGQTQRKENIETPNSSHHLKVDI